MAKKKKPALRIIDAIRVVNKILPFVGVVNKRGAIIGVRVRTSDVQRISRLMDYDVVPGTNGKVRVTVMRLQEPEDEFFEESNQEIGFPWSTPEKSVFLKMGKKYFELVQDRHNLGEYYLTRY